MTLTQSEQREIMRQDRMRRQLQEQNEILDLLGIAYPEKKENLAPSFLPNHARDTRYSEPWKSTSDRCVGVAPGTEDSADTPTVRVRYADGSTEIRTVASFRKSRIRTTRQVVTAAQVPETARIGVTHILTGD